MYGLLGKKLTHSYSPAIHGLFGLSDYVLFEKDDLVIYNESSCIIYTYKGKIKFDDAFRGGVRLIIPTENAYRYVLSTNASIETVRLN